MLLSRHVLSKVTRDTRQDYPSIRRFFEPFDGPLLLRDDYIPPELNLVNEYDLGQQNNPITESNSQPQPQTKSGTDANVLLSKPLITILG